MHLDEFFTYKNQLMEDLLTDKTIVKLINDKIDLEDAGSLIWDQVMPVEFYPDTLEKGRVYVCCDVDIRKVMNSTFYKPTLYIWVFVHKDLLRLDEGGVRTDKLCHLIDKKINGSMMYGLGKLELQTVHRFGVVSDYTGKVLSYEATDFNKTFDARKEIPSRRKI